MKLKDLFNEVINPELNEGLFDKNKYSTSDLETNNDKCNEIVKLIMDYIKDSDQYSEKAKQNFFNKRSKDFKFYVEDWLIEFMDDMNLGSWDFKKNIDTVASRAMGDLFGDEGLTRPKDQYDK